LWRASHTLAVFVVAGCSISLPEPTSPAQRNAPEEVLSRAEAGLTSSAEELPDNLVPSDREIGDPTAVVGMTVRLYAGEKPQLPSSPNHAVEYEPYSLRTIVITSTPGAEVEPWELEYALESDDAIDADHEAIRAVSRSVTRSARSDSEKVRRLVRWVYSNMSYQISNTPRASDVLAVKIGDCTEYTQLFLALARAATIPARRVIGLAYTEYRGRPAFGYHAWAEVAIDGRWVPVDPTWNEVVADATHIKLSEGWSDRWVASVGQIDIEVLDVVRRSGWMAGSPIRDPAEDI